MRAARALVAPARRRDRHHAGRSRRSADLPGPDRQRLVPAVTGQRPRALLVRRVPLSARSISARLIPDRQRRVLPRRLPRARPVVPAGVALGTDEYPGCPFPTPRDHLGGRCGWRTFLERRRRSVGFKIPVARVALVVPCEKDDAPAAEAFGLVVVFDRHGTSVLRTPSRAAGTIGAPRDAKLSARSPRDEIVEMLDDRSAPRPRIRSRP